MQPPTGIILGLPPPARTPTNNLPVRSRSGSTWSPALVFHWLSPRCPLSLLLSCTSFSSSRPWPPSSSQQVSFFSASFSAGSCPTTLRAEMLVSLATATFNSTQTHLMDRFLSGTGRTLSASLNVVFLLSECNPKCPLVGHAAVMYSLPKVKKKKKMGLSSSIKDAN